MSLYTVFVVELDSRGALGGIFDDPGDAHLAAIAWRRRGHRCEVTESSLASDDGGATGYLVESRHKLRVTRRAARRAAVAV